MSAEDYAVMCFPAWRKAHQLECAGKSEDEIIEMFAEYWCNLGEDEQ